MYDHLVRLYDISESLRDLVGGALDTYLLVVNNRMNDVMKTLTVITDPPAAGHVPVDAPPGVDVALGARTPGMLESWKCRAMRLKRETYALYLAYRDPRTPWYAKVFVALVVGYALSPIDLIPDPIPILGYLDDLILVPLGIALALRMIPPAVLEECREQAWLTMEQGKPTNWTAAIAIIAIWLLAAIALAVTVSRLFWG